MSSIRSLPGAGPGTLRTDDTPEAGTPLTARPLPSGPTPDQIRRERQRREMAANHERLQHLAVQHQPTASLGSEAFEEITFMASEREEAEFHEELHDSHVEEAELVHGVLTVEKVTAVMRLMEGQQGFLALRARARQFARDFSRDREGALSRLKPESFRPEVRFAIMRMAQDLLEQTSERSDTSEQGPQPSTAGKPDRAEKAEIAETVKALRQLEHQDADQVQHLIKVYGSARKEGDDAVAAPGSPLFQYLSSPLTARVLMDAIGSREGLQTLSDQVSRLPTEGYFDQPGAFVGLSVGLAQMMAVVRSMDDHVGGLCAALKLPPAEHGKLMRGLMDMCRTAQPRPKLEKLRSDVLRVAGAHQSLRFDHELLRQVSQYPESVWISVDAKSAVQGWLREAQGLHYRREGVLGITGDLDREALKGAAAG